MQPALSRTVFMSLPPRRVVLCASRCWLVRQQQYGSSLVVQAESRASHSLADRAGERSDPRVSWRATLGPPRKDVPLVLIYLLAVELLLY